MGAILSVTCDGWKRLHDPPDHVFNDREEQKHAQRFCLLALVVQADYSARLKVSNMSVKCLGSRKVKTEFILPGLWDMRHDPKQKTVTCQHHGSSDVFFLSDTPDYTRMQYFPSDHCHTIPRSRRRPDPLAFRCKQVQTGPNRYVVRVEGRNTTWSRVFHEHRMILRSLVNCSSIVELKETRVITRTTLSDDHMVQGSHMAFPILQVDDRIHYDPPPDRPGWVRRYGISNTSPSRRVAVDP